MTDEINKLQIWVLAWERIQPLLEIVATRIVGTHPWLRSQIFHYQSDYFMLSATLGFLDRAIDDEDGVVSIACHHGSEQVTLSSDVSGPGGVIFAEGPTVTLKHQNLKDLTEAVALWIQQVEVFLREEVFVILERELPQTPRQ